MRIFPLLAGCLLSTFFLLADSSTTPLANEIFLVPRGSLSEIKAAVTQLLSPQGKVILLPVERKIFVQDIPENLAAVRELIQAFNQPRPNVRVEVSLTEFGQASSGDVSIRTKGKLRVDPIYKNEFEIKGSARTDKSDSLASQMLLVQSGGRAQIRVVQRLPEANYLRGWCRQNGYISPEFNWTEVGTQLEIHPTIQGNIITVAVTPQITSFQDVLTIKELSTTVSLTSGDTIRIGGFDKASSEFNAYFFGLGASRSSTSGAFTLRASIEEMPDQSAVMPK